MSANQPASKPKSDQVVVTSAASADDISAELESRRARIRELTDQRNALSDVVEKASDAVAAAHVNGSTKDLETERARVREATEGCNELSRAIALVEKEVAKLDGDLKSALQCEALAVADALEAQVRAAAVQLRERVDDFVSMAVLQAAELNEKIHQANIARGNSHRLSFGGVSTRSPLGLGRLDFHLNVFTTTMEEYVTKQRQAAAQRRTFERKRDAGGSETSTSGVEFEIHPPAPSSELAAAGAE